MSETNETGFEVVKFYDPSHVMADRGPKMVWETVTFLNSLTIRDVFADEMKRLGEIVGMLEKLHGEMIQRRAH